MPNFEFEKSFNGRVAGVDEAGRGPWAGPVVAAAVVLDLQKMPPPLITELTNDLDDSKKLSAKRRDFLFERLHSNDSYIDIGIGIANVEEIDSVNILQATFLAMQRSVAKLSIPIDTALIDGNKAPKLDCAVKTIIGGDGKSLSIAAASVVAKVTRARIIVNLGLDFPMYGWERNKGYGTKEHSTALSSFGITAHHRKSYKPVRLHIKK